MKKVLSIMVVFVLLFSTVAFAGGTSSDNGPMAKLGRGVMNVFDAVVEVPGTMIRTSDEEGAAVGMTKGLLLGVVNTATRAVAGAYEMVTFPIPVPADYAPVMSDPEFLNK